MLMKLLNETEADHIVVIFDASRSSFRNEMFGDYKANRTEPPSELIPQFKLVREAARAFNVPVVEMEGYEADDIIATYALQANEAGADVTIVSSDKDLMQLVQPGIVMYDTMKNKVIGEAEVIASIPSYFVDPERACPATTYYLSAQAHGTLALVTSHARKARIVERLMKKYQPEGGHVPIDGEHPLYKKAIAGLLAVAFVATVIPALRILRLDPALTLRAE